MEIACLTSSVIPVLIKRKLVDHQEDKKDVENIVFFI